MTTQKKHKLKYATQSYWKILGLPVNTSTLLSKTVIAFAKPEEENKVAYTEIAEIECYKYI